MGSCALCYIWNLFGVMVFQRSMLDWPGGPLAKVCLSAKFALIYVSCFGVVVLHGSMVNWRRESICHRSMLHHYTSPATSPWIHATLLHLPYQATIDPCYTVTPHKSALIICAWCCMWNSCGVVVFQGSMLDWRGCSQSVMKLIWCSGLTWIYGQLEEGVGSVCHETDVV